MREMITRHVYRWPVELLSCCLWLVCESCDLGLYQSTSMLFLMFASSDWRRVYVRCTSFVLDLLKARAQTGKVQSLAWWSAHMPR